MSRNIKDNTFYLNNYINQNQFNQVYDLKQQIDETESANAIVKKLMLISKKAIKQR